MPWTEIRGYSYSKRRQKSSHFNTWKIWSVGSTESWHLDGIWIRDKLHEHHGASRLNHCWDTGATIPANARTWFTVTIVNIYVILCKFDNEIEIRIESHNALHYRYNQYLRNDSWSSGRELALYALGPILMPDRIALGNQYDTCYFPA